MRISTASIQWMWWWTTMERWRGYPWVSSSARAPWTSSGFHSTSRTARSSLAAGHTTAVRSTSHSNIRILSATATRRVASGRSLVSQHECCCLIGWLSTVLHKPVKLLRATNAGSLATWFTRDKHTNFSNLQAELQYKPCTVIKHKLISIPHAYRHILARNSNVTF